MELLDAALAFALTLAALATVVTVLMEIALRAALMRKRSLVQVMRLLNDELPGNTFNLDENQRWEFFKKVVENPAQGLAEHIPKTLKDGDTAAKAFENIDWRCLRTGVYDKVSTEHVLRRLAEIEPVKKLSEQASDTVKKEFYRLACKYEEFGSAVSASFKRSAQFWSIIFGIGLAIVANVDGVRIFESFQANTNLTQTVIARHDQIRAAYAPTEERKRNITLHQEQLIKAKTALAEARDKYADDSPEVKSAQQAVDTADKALPGSPTPRSCAKSPKTPNSRWQA